MEWINLPIEMNHELSPPVLVGCFAATPTILLWMCSVIFIPNDWILHMVDFVGIVSQFLFYFSFHQCFIPFYLMYMIIFIGLHCTYTFQLGPFVFVVMVLLHLMLYRVLFSVRDNLVLYFILVEMFLRVLSITTYLIFSSFQKNDLSICRV